MVGAVACLKKKKRSTMVGITVIGLLQQPYVFLSQDRLMRTVAGAVFRTEAELSFSLPISHPVAPLL